ncbi:MAG: hypothetical protein N3G22_04000 [Candidatus Micrarchaeota archaeon]|nr:hypothetical protein [Candidatus Micrarchaeota archaeon]
MDFIEEILRVQKPQAKLVDSLAERYSAIAFKFGYLEAQSPCWLFFIRKDGQTAAFELQFGNVSEFKSSLKRLNESGANLCFFITSSLAHTMRLEEVKGLLLRNFEIKNQKFVLIDIESGRHIKVNFEWERFEKDLGLPPLLPEPKKPIFREGRRKKIYGRRGMHKQQD